MGDSSIPAAPLEIKSGEPVLLQPQPELLVDQLSGHQLLKLDGLILP